MQRKDADGMIIISCDFCGADWDQVLAMIEGHHGSVLCLECLKVALEEASPAAAAFDCTLCLRDRPAGTICWRPLREPGATLPPGANPQAVACMDCLNQAAGTFSKDPDVPWKRPSRAT